MTYVNFISVRTCLAKTWLEETLDTDQGQRRRSQILALSLRRKSHSGEKNLGKQLITARGSGGEGEGRPFSAWRPGELTLPVEGLGNGFRQIWGPIDWPLFLQRSWSGGRDLWILLTLAALGTPLSPQRPRRRPPSLMGF